LKQMDYKFTKKERLRSKKEFAKVFNDGRVFKGRYIVSYVLPNGYDYSRLGLVVSRKKGNAVRRNRIKRLLRESFRLNKNLLIIKVDMVIIPRYTFSTNLKLSDIEAGMKELFHKINTTLW